MSITLMADPLPIAPNFSPRKRNHEGDLIDHTPGTAQSLNEIKSATITSRQQSPALSDTGSELTDITSTSIIFPAPKITSLDGTSDISNTASDPPKKRKLTFAEREFEKAAKQREKEEKAKQKEEEKRQRDEEKRKKEEEKEASKRAKEIEKAEKKKVRDAEKQEKEADKIRKESEKKDKEQEKLKKERSQLRIGAFFGRPAPQSTPPTTPDDVSSGASSRRSSIAAINMSEPILNVEALKPSNPEFEKYIIPYFIHENTEVAPVNRFQAARGASCFEGKQFESGLEVERMELEPLRTRFGPAKTRMKMTEPVRNIAEHIQSKRIDASDVSGDYNPLAFVPYKILCFREDIRPPYIGTYTRNIAPNMARKLSRKPTHRGRVDTNYDYDSEAEWEEPAADDEEILDDEMSESEDGDEEMQDFLDDEDDQVRKRLFAGEMEPISSGICFQGHEYDSNGHDMNTYRMEVLHDSISFPIDPFSTIHWSDIGKGVPAITKAESNVQVDGLTKVDQITKCMPPPRVPLSAVNSPNTLNSYLAPGNTIVVSQNENHQVTAKQKGRAANPNKEIKMISAEYLDAFKQAVCGSDLTKAGLIEVLKKQFPKCSKDAIKDTLGVIAVRVGKKEVEKKWELV